MQQPERGISVGKTKSIFFNLIAPICIVTLSILVFSSAAIFTVYTRQAQEASIQSNLEILRQTGASLELLHGHISKIAASIAEKPYMRTILEQPIRDIKQEYDSRQKLGFLFAGSPNAMVDYETAIFGSNGIAVSSGNGGVTLSSGQLMALPVFKQASDTGHITYDSSLSGLSFASRGHTVILGCKALYTKGEAPYGGVVISIREDSVRKFYQSFISKSNHIILLADNGTVLSSTRPEKVGTTDFALLSTARENRANDLEYSRSNEQGIVLSCYLSYLDVYVISQIMPPPFPGSLKVHAVALTIITLALLLLIIMAAWIIRHNLRPLKVLAEHMVSAKDIPSPIHLHSSSEMTMITTAYNEMVETLNRYLNELNAAYDKRREDELNLLQMQINPHFLYNTLDSVKHMVSTANSLEACTTISSLIALLRSTLGKTDTLVSVADEVCNVQNYISIIQPRYGGLIQADVHADEASKKLSIPNLLLQPFVENAFFHAFQETKSGSIRIFISTDGMNLICEIIDNGDGMSPKQLEHLLNDRGLRHLATRIGIANVRERLNILYPGENTFLITSEPGYGTSVHITFRC